MSDSFATILGALFLIDEAPYVGVKLRPTLSGEKTGRSENNAFTLYTIQSCYLHFSRYFIED